MQYLIESILIFFLICITVFLMFLIYKKRTSQVDLAYSRLKEYNYLPNDFFVFHKYLGFWGFGTRIYILDRILRGKSFLIKKGVYFTALTEVNVLDKSEFRWIRFYYKLVILLCVIFVWLIFLVLRIRFHEIGA